NAGCDRIIGVTGCSGRITAMGSTNQLYPGNKRSRMDTTGVIDYGTGRCSIFIVGVEYHLQAGKLFIKERLAPHRLHQEKCMAIFFRTIFSFVFGYGLDTAVYAREIALTFDDAP